MALVQPIAPKNGCHPVLAELSLHFASWSISTPSYARPKSSYRLMLLDRTPSQSGSAAVAEVDILASRRQTYGIHGTARDIALAQYV